MPADDGGAWRRLLDSHNGSYVNPFVQGLRLPRWLRFSSTVSGPRPVTRTFEKATPVAIGFESWGRRVG